jgi:hypothetical protein
MGKTIVPRKPLDRIAFYEAHIDPWTLNNAAIGLAPGDAADLQSLVDAAKNARASQIAARQAAEMATQSFNNAVEALSQKGSALITTIRGTAQNTGDLNIYELAALPQPQPPEPVAAPGAPYAPAVRLIAGGSLQLQWKCKNPANGPGVVYEIHRTDGTGAMVQIGTSGTRSFTDATLPAGTASVTYTITAVRSTKKGLPTQFGVQFGSGGGSGQTSMPMIRKAA